MITYQDFLNAGEEDTKRMTFCVDAVNNHKRSDIYETAILANEYYRKQNRTIMQFQKLLYTVSGQAVPDNYSSNFKLRKTFFNLFVTQQNQYLLGNGVSWENDTTEDALSNDRYEFDTQLQEAGRLALLGGVSFGFFNYDHVDVFSITEFVPLYDEENGSLRAGIRFWQLDNNKPMRITLYEEDGYTDYVYNEGKGEVLHPKRTYKQVVKYTPAGGEEIFDGENYPSFPIVPFWGNPEHQSELVGLQEKIDCYDLIESGFANTVDEASLIYWTINNAGGMDDIDLAEFVKRIRTVHAAVVSDDGATAESHAIESPYESRERLLDRLRKDLFEDYMALDTKEIAASAATATQIRAAYDPVDDKADKYEFCVLQFINGILSLAGIEDNPTFTRSKIVNTQEDIMTVLSAAEYLDEEYITRKILDILGDGDLADSVLERMQMSDYGRSRANAENDRSGQGDEQGNRETGKEDTRKLQQGD